MMVDGVFFSVFDIIPPRFRSTSSPPSHSAPTRILEKSETLRRKPPSPLEYGWPTGCASQNTSSHPLPKTHETHWQNATGRRSRNPAPAPPTRPPHPHAAAALPAESAESCTTPWATGRLPREKPAIGAARSSPHSAPPPALSQRPALV